MMAMLVVSFAHSLKKQTAIEAVGDMVKVTYLHDNGQVQQQGFYKTVNYKENGYPMMLMETELPLQYIKGEKNRNMAFFGMIQFK
jgi:hypothetical protein